MHDPRKANHVITKVLSVSVQCIRMHSVEWRHFTVQPDHEALYKLHCTEFTALQSRLYYAVVVMKRDKVMLRHIGSK